jgi:hypothetical protein
VLLYLVSLFLPDKQLNHTNKKSLKLRSSVFGTTGIQLENRYRSGFHRTRKLHGFLYQIREKTGRYRNRNAPKLSKNNANNYDANVVVAQAVSV